jgi:hypothetical protein
VDLLRAGASAPHLPAVRRRDTGRLDARERHVRVFSVQAIPPFPESGCGRDDSRASSATDDHSGGCDR